MIVLLKVEYREITQWKTQRLLWILDALERNDNDFKVSNQVKLGVWV